MRVNAETLRPDGSVLPSAGTITVFDPPTGPGVRVDTAARTGGAVNPRFDALVAKVITWGDTLEAALQRARRALGELRVEGVATNAGLLAALVAHPDVAAGRVTTRFVDEHLDELLAQVTDVIQAGDGSQASGVPHASDVSRAGDLATAGNAGLAGARLDSDDPLAVLHLGKAAAPTPAVRPATPNLADGHVAVVAPLQGTVIELAVGDGRPGPRRPGCWP